MSKQYLRCINSTDCKLNQFEIYLCEPRGRTVMFKVYDCDNNFMGDFRKTRFASIGDTNKEMLDHGIETLKKKVHKLKKKQAEAKTLRAEIKSIYKQVGKQLKLEL